MHFSRRFKLYIGVLSCTLFGLQGLTGVAQNRGSGAPQDMGAASTDKAPQIIVISAVKDEALQAKFVQQRGWTGADGAGTILLDGEKTLWLFGDTFIGEVDGGKRRNAAFINNSAAWQSLHNQAEPLRFFWSKLNRKPDALLKPRQPGQFYWPVDGALIDKKLYLLMRRVKLKKDARGPFAFDVIGCDLVTVDNPLAEPNAWVHSTKKLEQLSPKFEAATACINDERYLYVYGRVANKTAGKPEALAVARLPLIKLKGEARLTGWQYLCVTAGGAQWRSACEQPAVLFGDPAPEMSVSRWPGISGYIATYMPPFSKVICFRHADKPEGPWSERTILYECPQTPENVFLYNARAHPELATKGGAVPITYCRNSWRDGDHADQPDLYLPQAVVAKLQEVD